jgi:hypothetical protein
MKWERFKVPQKAEHQHASLLQATLKKVTPENNKAVNKMRMNDELK